jgi:hypothetical protein
LIIICELSYSIWDQEAKSAFLPNTAIGEIFGRIANEQRHTNDDYPERNRGQISDEKRKL